MKSAKQYAFGSSKPCATCEDLRRLKARIADAYRDASKTDGSGLGVTRNRRPFNRSSRPVKFALVQGGTE